MRVRQEQTNVRGDRRVSRRQVVGGAVGIAAISTGFAAPIATRTSAAQDADVAKLASNLLLLEQGVYGVVLMQPDGTVIFKQNANLPFVTASLYKLIVMVDFYRSREFGEIDFEQWVVLEESFFPVFEGDDEDVIYDSTMVGAEVQISELLFNMITLSSNVAARALLSLTAPEVLNEIAANLGMSSTHLLLELKDVSPWPPESISGDNPAATEEALRFVAQQGEEGVVNITTPADIATFFMELSNREIVSPEASDEMISLLEQQGINDRLPALLPEGTVCAHKTGDLVNVVHDAGIVYGEAGPMIVAVLSEAVPDHARTISVIQCLGLIAYGDYNLPPIPDAATPVPGSTPSWDG
jgi:beta-lactamase class A